MPSALELYESHVSATLSRVYQREGESLVVDPSDLRTPLVAVLEAEREAATDLDPETIPQDMEGLLERTTPELARIIEKLLRERDDRRSAALVALLDFCFAKGPDPLAALERLFLLSWAVHKGHDWNMRQTEMARLLGQSKQNWNQIAEKTIEELVSRYSRHGYILGGKSAAAREKYSKQKQGNRSRAHGKRQGDEIERTPDAEETASLSNTAKSLAKKARLDAERRRLAELCGCDPSEIDLDRIDPLD